MTKDIYLMRALPRPHLASFVIGGIQLTWAAGLFFSNGGRLLAMLNLYSVKWIFLACLLISGLMCMLGAFVAHRRIRHGGLMMTSFVCLPAFFVLLGNNMVGIMSLSLPFISLSAALALVMDIRRKPRCQSG